MTFVPPRIRERWYPSNVVRRFRFFLSGLLWPRLHNTKKVSFVTINGHRYKRLIFSDSTLARDVEQTIRRFGPTDQFPSVVARYERELWMDYIEGPRVRAPDEVTVAKLAAFYSSVYARAPRCERLSGTPFLAELQGSLRFLHQVGILESGTSDALCRSAERFAPEYVWVGFDYMDPVLKNFVIPHGHERLCAVDVESLLSDQLIGMGVAKACARWMDPWRKVFFDCLERDGRAPDFVSYFPFVELYFLATWTKLYFLERKWKRIDPSQFARFLESA